MSTVMNSVAAGSLEEIAELIGLSTAGLDMRNHFPKDVPAGRGCGIFFGLGGGVHVPVGSGKLVEITATRLSLQGEFNYLTFKGSAAAVIELTGPGSARLQIPAASPGWMNAKAWKEGNNLYYQILDGPMANARIKQIFANAGWFEGAYVEFHITLQDGKYGEVKYWFHKS